MDNTIIPVVLTKSTVSRHHYNLNKLKMAALRVPMIFSLLLLGIVSTLAADQCKCESFK